MKVSAYILTLVFGLVLAMLHVQPLFYIQQIKEAMDMQAKHEESCCKSKSTCRMQQPVEDEEENGCKSQGCNPFVPCSMGSCCCLVENFFSPAPIPLIKKQKLALFDDNRLSDKLSECWQPPESFS